MGRYNLPSATPISSSSLTIYQLSPAAAAVILSALQQLVARESLAVRHLVACGTATTTTTNSTTSTPTPEPTNLAS